MPEMRLSAWPVQRLGFSDTLGAFAAGVLLSETNFRTQVGPQAAAAVRDVCRSGCWLAAASCELCLVWSTA